jgi:hypothetical protein
MTSYRIAWRCVTAAVAVLAMGATILTVPVSLFLAIAFAFAMFGALFAVAFQDDLEHVRHPIVKGALLGAAPALIPGLGRVVGPVAGLLALGLALASPWVVGQAVKRVRPWLTPANVVQAGMAAPDEALRRQWVESSRLLREASTVSERAMVVHVREQILDDLAARNDGDLPPFVWAEAGPADGLARRAGEPHQPG